MLSYRFQPPAAAWIAEFARARRRLAAEFGERSELVERFTAIAFRLRTGEPTIAIPAAPRIAVTVHLDPAEMPRPRRASAWRAPSRLSRRLQREAEARGDDPLADLLDARSSLTDDPLDDDLPLDLRSAEPAPRRAPAPIAPPVAEVVDRLLAPHTGERTALMRRRLKLRRVLEHSRARGAAAGEDAHRIANATIRGPGVRRTPRDQDRVDRARRSERYWRERIEAETRDLVALDDAIAARAETIAAARTALRPIVAATLAGTSPDWRYRDGRLFDAKGRDVDPLAPSPRTDR